MLRVILEHGLDDVPISGDPAVRVNDESGRVLAHRLRIHDMGIVPPAPDGHLGPNFCQDTDHTRQDAVNLGRDDRVFPLQRLFSGAGLSRENQAESE